MRAIALLLLSLVVMPDIAGASGFACTGSGKRVELELDVSTDPERGGAIYDALGRATIKVSGKTRFVTLDLDQSHVAQFWSEEEELRIRFARRGEPEEEAEAQSDAAEAEAGGDVEDGGRSVKGNAELVVLARRDAGTGELEGTWRLATTALDAEASGSLVCQVDAN